MKTALYLRVSTIDQTTENQVPDLEALAHRRGFEITGRFSENVSAVKARPEYEKMIAAAHRGKFDALLVWSLDRLHRSMVGALQTVLDLDRRGVQVVQRPTWPTARARWMRWMRSVLREPTGQDWISPSPTGQGGFFFSSKRTEKAPTACTASTARLGGGG